MDKMIHKLLFVVLMLLGVNAFAHGPGPKSQIFGDTLRTKIPTVATTVFDFPVGTDTLRITQVIVGSDTSWYITGARFPSVVDTAIYLRNTGAYVLAAGDTVGGTTGLHDFNRIVTDTMSATLAALTTLRMSGVDFTALDGPGMLEAAGVLGVVAGTGIIVNANDVEATLGTDIALGEMQANSVDSTKIVQRSVGLTDLAQEGATAGQVLKWDGTDWNPGADDSTGGGGSVWGEGTAVNDTSVSYTSNDTIVKIRGSNDSTFITPGDNTTLVIGDEGLTIIDSAQIGNLYVDTIFLDGDTLSEDKLPAYSVRLKVRNSGTGATLPAGTPVYMTGTITGNAMHVDSAKASSAALMPAVGILQNDIADPANGYAILSGRIMGLNTSGFTINDGLYVGSDGGLTATRPMWPDSVQKVAIVTKVDGANGFIDVMGAGRSNDLPNLPDSHFFVGSGSGAPIAVDMTGDVTMSNAGVTTVSGTIPASQVKMDTLGVTTFTTVQEMQNIFHSVGWVSGGAFTDTTDGTAGDSVYVAAGTGLIRAEDNSDTTTIFYCDWGDTTLIVGTDTTRFIGVEYNAGAPRVFSTVDYTDFNWQTNFDIGTAINESDVLHLEVTQHAIGDHATKMIRRTDDVAGIQRANRQTGLALGETGTRNITVTSGYLWDKLNIKTFTTKNTSTGDNFDRYYRAAGGGFTKQAAQTQWNNTQWDDGSGGLATLGNNKWATQWFYAETDDEAVSVFGRVEHNSAAAAAAEDPPATLPDRLIQHGLLIGWIVFQESAATISEIRKPGPNTSSVLASDHGNLSNLEDTSHHSYAFKYTDTAAYTTNIREIYFDTVQVVDTIQAMLQRLFDTTATDAQILVANGTKFNSVAMSGDVTIDNAGVTTVGTVDETDIKFADSSDVTKLGRFEMSGITTSQERVLTWPNADGTISLTTHGHAGFETITNVAKIGDDTTNYQTAYTHSQDNSQAHTDYFLNTGDVGTGVNDFGGATSLEIPNGTNPATTVEGQWAWDTDDNAGEFYDGTRSVLIPTRFTPQALIWNPDLITDTVPVIELDSATMQGGLVIENLSVLTSEDGTYALKFFIFTSADPPVLHDYVDTLNVGASDQFVSSNTFENVDAQTLDVGQRLYMLTPATDIDWIKIKVRYYIKDNN